MPHLPRNLMIALSPTQGMALLFLWRAAVDGTWPRSLRRRKYRGGTTRPYVA